jgi:hypothetical protein
MKIDATRGMIKGKNPKIKPLRTINDPRFRRGVRDVDGGAVGGGKLEDEFILDIT